MGPERAVCSDPGVRVKGPCLLPERCGVANIRRVDAKNEEHAVQAVEERLRARFPDIDPTEVKHVVRGAHAELTGPLRDYVPVLVEHAARERLSQQAPVRRAPNAPTTQVPGRASR